MTDRDAVHRAIIEEPDNDLHRLVFADILEEEGEDARANFIRQAISHPHNAFCELVRDDPFPLLGLPHGPLTPRPNVFDDKVRLWGWYEDDRHGLVVLDNTRNDACYRVDRGFISKVICEFDNWLQTGPELMTLHPIEELVISDKVPLVLPVNYDAWWWEPGFQYGGSYQLPNWFCEATPWKAEFPIKWIMMYRFDSSELAVEALSMEALRIAKEHAFEKRIR